MKNYCLEKLEYNKILEILSSYCKTYIGKEIALQTNPVFNKQSVKKMLSETTEAKNMINSFGNIPLDILPNIETSIKYLEGYNPLSCKSLLDIGKVLRQADYLKSYFFCDQVNIENFPILEELFSNIYCNDNIKNKILNTILDENTIDDHATSNLSSIRRNIRSLEQDIKSRLNSMIHSSSYSKYIMEPIVTIRNNRYVIPIKIEYKENIHGFVHDISASGSTVFIEPTSIFELNSKLNNLKLDEEIEIGKILNNLSTLCYPIASNLKNLIKIIGQLDFIFAKACYSSKINATEPIINDEKFLDLNGARHPLIDGNKVVPINISLGLKYKSLIITGPNTGGKTVTIKTVGLLLLMACSGLHIPAKENSSIYVFDGIFADIGDMQSIQESLSTFSSHMINITNILSKITENSLILVDELGSGTDPIEGAALAISILEYIYDLGALSITTTHYTEIKNYAISHYGFENAACEFDIQTLSPTYKLLIGVPGKSNAFEISKRLGLPKTILDNAKNMLNNDTVKIEDLLKSIYDDKNEIEKEKELIQKNSSQIEILRKSLEKQVSAHEEKEKTLIEKAKLDARNILLKAKQEANDIIKELNNLSSSKNGLKEANTLRNNINNLLKDKSPTIENTVSNQNENISSSDIFVGMTIIFKPLNSLATVLTLPNKSNDLQIQIGNAKMIANLNQLKKTDKTAETAETNKSIKSTSYRDLNLKAKNVSSEINVIGMNVEEATFVIDKYLDDCVIAKLSTVRIVHGKGTGKLKNGIHIFLKKHPHVQSFRLGTFGEGEMGVTVVELV